MTNARPVTTATATTATTATGTTGTKGTTTSPLTHGLSLGWSLPLLAFLLAWPVIADATGSEFYTGLLTRILILAIAATSLNLILGFGGMVSLGHAAFVGLGAYTVGICAQHGIYPAWITWPLAFLVGGIFAFVFGLISLRAHGIYLIMITLALAQMLYYLVVSISAFGGEDGLPLDSRSALGAIDLGDDTRFYYVVLTLFVLALAWVQRMLNARFGQVLQGIRENETRMSASGFAVFRHKLVAYVLAGALAGLAGALLANQSYFVSPAMLYWDQSGVLIVMVILGGVGHLYGGLAGAAAYLGMEEFLSQYTEHWQFFLGAALLAVVLFIPAGLMSLASRKSKAAESGAAESGAAESKAAESSTAGAGATEPRAAE